MTQNAFEALCAKAGAEKWCWNIGCTTCGHLHFRSAFRDLSAGVHPNSKAWRVNRKQTHGYGDVPQRLTGDEQRQLARLCAGASISQIAKLAPFPDWLGFMGLALLYTQDDERASGEVTAAWVPQLLSLLPNEGLAREQLLAITDNKDRRLSWRHLEVVECGLRLADRTT